MLVVAIAGIASVAVGLIAGVVTTKLLMSRKIKEAVDRGRSILEDAKKEATAIRQRAELEAKDIKLQAKTEFEKETQARLKELQQVERRLLTKEENLEKKFNLLEEREEELRKQVQSVGDRKKYVEGLEHKYKGLVLQVQRELEKVSGISRNEAKEELKNFLIDEAKKEASKMIKRVESEARENAVKKAQKIVSSAIERMASEFVSERSISVVHLPDDDMKGRIIGREGRNIRALEAATGVDVIIDDTPEAVVISAFNPIRREVAKVALEKLIQDGRIHPARIEEVVNKVEKEVEQNIKEAGEQTLYELDIHDVHPEVVKLVGSLKYRFSFAQNVLAHSKEVGFLAGMMAAELGLDERKARRAGLLHDIGKAVSHEVKGSHALIGMDLARKYGEDPGIVYAIGAHHEDLPQESPLDCIVSAADALSGARPGARREVLETYVKRIEELEKIAASFDGVEKVYAMQAGREIRVMVDCGEVDDSMSVILARDIAKRIEEEMSYPGEIKVTVIRETRAVDYAR